MNRNSYPVLDMMQTGSCPRNCAECILIRDGSALVVSLTSTARDTLDPPPFYMCPSISPPVDSTQSIFEVERVRISGGPGWLSW